jgi:hypothetical protein
MFSATSRRPQSSTGIEEVIVDPRDIDKVLSELAGMIGRWRLFRKFITESLKVWFLGFGYARPSRRYRKIIQTRHMQWTLVREPDL